MINLMFCGNEKVFDGLIISLISIVKYTKQALNIYILTMDLSDIDEKFKPINNKQKNILEKLIQEKNKNSKITLIDITKLFKEELLKSANIKTHYTPYILVRLFSDKIDIIPDKILYLDSDIVCYKSIDELYNINIEQYELGGALDYFGRRMINSKYINSGVLLMNMKLIREHGSFIKARKMCKNKKMLLPDQTALNKICKKKLYLSRKFNEQKAKQSDTVIRHFSMTMKFFPTFKLINIKPWQIDKVHEIYQIYDYEDIIKEYLKIKDTYIKGEIK